MMAKQGLKSLFPMEDIAVMGIWELLPHLKKLQVRFHIFFTFRKCEDLIYPSSFSFTLLSCMIVPLFIMKNYNVT